MRQQIRARILSVAALVGVVGVAIAPVAASAATASANTTINAVIASVISISTSSTVTLNITPVSGGNQTSASDTVSVSTNNATGYKLYLKDSDATLTLTNGANTIAASANVWNSAAALANNTWGYAIPTATTGAPANNFDASYSGFTDQGSHASVWVGITASDQQLKNTATTASGDTTTVWYSAKADTSKPNGTYSDTVTYTATTN